MENNKYKPGGCIRCKKSPITFNKCPWNKGMTSSDLLAQNKECWVSGSKESKYNKYPTLKYPNIYSVKYVNGKYILNNPKGYYRYMHKSRLGFWQGN
jgi:hypothetical protein